MKKEEKKKKSAAGFLTVSGVVLMTTGVIGFVCSLYSLSRADKEFDSFPVIECENDLRREMQEEPHIVKMLNVTVTGDTVTDPCEVFDDEFIFVKWEKNICRYNEIKGYDQWQEASSEQSFLSGDNLYFYGDIKAEMSENTEIHAESITVTGDSNPDEEHIEFIDNILFYYPDGISYSEGAVRYSPYGIIAGTGVTTLASVGNGRVVPEPLADKNVHIFSGNRPDELKLLYSETSAGLFGISVMLIVTAVLLLVTAVIIRAVNVIKKANGSRAGAQ